MAAVDNIRNGLIDKILAIRNEEFLIALDNLIACSSENTGTVQLTEEQKLMLQLSEEDIRHGRVSSESDLQVKTSEWLKAKSS